MKKFLLFALPLFTGIVYSQVGINSSLPTSTLDVTGKLGNSDKDGLQAPRLTRAQLTSKGNSLYTANQIGAIIYITDISGGDATAPQRTNVTTPGYYYFDGTLWVALKPSTTNSLTNPTSNTIRSTVNGVTASPDASIVSTVANTVAGNTISSTVNGIAGTAVTVPNIYTADGSLTSNRVVTQGNNTLTFTGTAAGTNKFINTSGTATAPVPPLQIQDGGQGLGKLLTSDASGNATWQPNAITKITGTIVAGSASTNSFLNNTTTAKNLGSYITLPPGLWEVEINVLLDVGTSNVLSYTWAKFTLADNSSSITQSADLTGVNKLVSGGVTTVSVTGDGNPYYGTANGKLKINNTSAANKSYYLLFWGANYKGTTRTINMMGTDFYAENFISAMRIK